MAEVAAAPSVRWLLGRASETLAEAGVDTSRLDAELLLSEALGVGREQLVMGADQPVHAFELTRFHRLLERRAAREPVAYIVGQKAFRHIELAVDPRVLIPRPETEVLVEAGLGLSEGARVIDVGTGSGAVALALKDERPDLQVLGCDESTGALEVARANADRLGLDVAFVRADLLDGVDGPFDAVLANLPYVAEGTALPPEISLHEPGSALFGGPDGLHVIRCLIGMLEDVAWVALEVGFDQADAVVALLRQAGFRSVERMADLAGHERVVVGRR